MATDRNPYNKAGMSRNPRPIESLLLPLKPESLQCLHRFIEYERPSTKRFPKSRTAAVAIVLFVGRLGDLYVLLSTRAGSMRSYAHDTALPGGKYEAGDEDEEGTARREAYEEIGLPTNREMVRRLCLLEPFLTGNHLIVTPVVFLVTDNTLNPILNPTEVSHLFSMPLMAFLHTNPTKIPGWHFGISTRLNPLPNEDVPLPPTIEYAQDEGEADGVRSRYYGFRDIKWGEGVVRMHRFLTGREGGGVKPVYGLTAAILLLAARVGYAMEPPFPVRAPGQLGMEERIKWQIEQGGPLRRAVEVAGLAQEWGLDAVSKL